MNKNEQLKTLIQSEQAVGLVETLRKYFGYNLKVEIGYSTTSIATSIDDINFSVRAHNALKRAGMFTIGDVIQAIQNDQLLKIRNLGKKSIAEIKTRILVFCFERLSAQEKETFWADLINLNA